MEEFKILPCRICLNVITDENYRVIEETIKNALDVLLLNLGVEETSKTAICNTCYTKLFAAFQFKVSCLDIERVVSAYVNSANMAPIDLREIYLKERGKKHSISALKDQIICRLCMQIVASEFTPITDVESDLITKYIQEINFGVTREPVICQSCLQSLRTHNDFLKRFLAANGHEESPYCIKTEEIEIKLERNDEDSEIPFLDEEPAELNFHEPLEAQPHDSEHFNFQIEQKDDFQNVSFSEALMYKYDSCHMDKTCDDQKCSLLDDKIKLEEGITQQLLSKNLSDVQMHGCDKCQFKTKYKSNLTHHQLLQHREISDVQVYNCDKCSFQTKHKRSIIRHQLTHRDISEVQMYKCAKCTFETKHKKSLVDHELIHKDASELQMYKCDACNYETKRKSYFRSHQRRHKNLSDVQVYKCGACSYETRYKSNFTQHEVIHKDISKLEVFKCDTCSYETKRKRNLISHELKHKQSSEVHIYKCDTCSYETKYKATLVCHQLRHKDISEVEMYKCDLCDYETRFKKHLRGHEAMHRRYQSVQCECVDIKVESHMQAAEAQAHF